MTTDTEMENLRASVQPVVDEALRAISGYLKAGPPMEQIVRGTLAAFVQQAAMLAVAQARVDALLSLPCMNKAVNRSRRFPLRARCNRETFSQCRRCSGATTAEALVARLKGEAGA